KDSFLALARARKIASIYRQDLVIRGHLDVGVLPRKLNAAATVPARSDLIKLQHGPMFLRLADDYESRIAAKREDFSRKGATLGLTHGLACSCFIGFQDLALLLPDSEGCPVGIEKLPLALPWVHSGQEGQARPPSGQVGTEYAAKIAGVLRGETQSFEDC